MTKAQIKKLAIKARLPSGWYNGPWFDDEGKIQSGISAQLVHFVELVQASAKP